MLFTTLLLSFFLAPVAVLAQTTEYTTVTVPFFPTGVAGSGGTGSESTIPFPCNEGCVQPAGSYYGCFINRTLFDGSGEVTQAECDDYFCSQGNFTQLAQCLNCIVANGGERPFGYSSNTSITAAPTANGDSPLPQLPFLIDAEEGSGMLKNVTDMCQAAGRAVTGASSITATPTTTGPYFTNYASGESLTRPTWTGLSGYHAPSAVGSYPVEAQASASSSSSSGSGSGSGAGAGAASASSSSSASASGQSGSQPSNGASSVQAASAGLGLVGLVVSWAIMLSVICQ